MPEEYPDSNTTGGDKIINQSDEKEDLENRDHSKIQKMLHIVQNFFNNVPSKWISNKNKDKNNKIAGQNNAVMSRNARNSPQKDISNGKENVKTQRNVNAKCRHRCCRMHQLKFNEKLEQSVSDPFEKPQLEKELESKAKDKNKDTGSNNAEVLLEDEKEMGSITKEPEKSIRVPIRNTTNLKPRCSCSGCQRLKISSKTIHRRHSEQSNRRISSSDNTTSVRPSSENLSLSKLSEKNVEPERMSHLRPGSVILLSEVDMNVKLTEFKPDVRVSFHQLSKFECNPGLMSGGQVVFQDFADIFMIPDYYADDPIILDDSPNDIHINEQSSLTISTIEIFVIENLFSGAKVTDNSSKGLILPVLFPVNPDILNWAPSLSDDERSSKSLSSGSDASLDFLSNTLAAREINSSNSDLDDVFLNESTDNDVATMSTDVTQNETEDNAPDSP